MNLLSGGVRWYVASLILFVSIPCPAQDKKPFRAARSVHLSYPAGAGVLFYNEVAVEKSVNGSYFMACGWNTGYFGIQQLEGTDDKLVLFSVWDPTQGDDPNAIKKEDRVEVLYQAKDVQIKRFGGEGTGGQCFWRLNWRIGETNRFLIGARVEGEKTAYTAWFKTEGPWKKLACFRTRTSGRTLSGYYSFIEDFRRDGNSVGEVRRARYGNGWVKTAAGNWLSLASARFTASNSEWESKDNIDAGIKDGVFYLVTGGDTAKTIELKRIIELPSHPTMPAELLRSLPAETANY
jgi:hypothetical protein